MVLFAEEMKVTNSCAKTLFVLVIKEIIIIIYDGCREKITKVRSCSSLCSFPNYFPVSGLFILGFYS